MASTGLGRGCAIGLVAALIVAAGGCNDSSDDNDSADNSGSKPTGKIGSGTASLVTDLDTVDFSGGKSLDLTLGYASSATHRFGDPADVVYTLTDRGPNIHGNAITGLSNPLNVTDTEQGYDASGKKLNLDPEGLVRLPDGSFWLDEEYGPSLVHVAADGTIEIRLVPGNEVNDLGGAGYPVAGKLPVILSPRKLNRGAESLAVSADGKTLYFAMQSPLANPDKAAYKTSRNIRLFTVKLENGRFQRITHEYVYRLDKPATFYESATGAGDKGANDNDFGIEGAKSIFTILPIAGRWHSKHRRKVRPFKD